MGSKNKKVEWREEVDLQMDNLKGIIVQVP
jgi:hypothetical protein